MESIIKDSISLYADNEYSVKCYIDEEEVLINSDEDLMRIIGEIQDGVIGDFYIDLTFNTIVGSKNFISIINQLSGCYNKNGNIDIFTSGRNIELCRSFLPVHVENVDVFVDDYEVKSVLKMLDFEKIKFNCHLSEKYLLNLDDVTFDYVCSHYNFKFDRDKIISKRALIESFWKVSLHDKNNLDKFSDIEKVMLVLDYINKNINYESNLLYGNKNLDSKFLSDPIEVLKKGRGDSSGMAKLACFLLNNYLSKVDCHEVEGHHKLSNVDMSWIVTKINGHKYGHCLIMPKRFKKLSNYGYVDGKMTLEPMHFSRKEYTAIVEGYSEFNDYQYQYLAYCLNDKVSSIPQIDKKNDLPFTYKKTNKNTRLS